MNLAKIRVDSAKAEEGRWIDGIPGLDDLRLKVRGIPNRAYTQLEQKLVSALPVYQRPGGRIDPKESDRIMVECLAETVLLEWGNLREDDGSEIPYSKEKARALLANPDYVALRNAVAWAAGEVAPMGGGG